MRVAILSDIHGNLEALEAVLERASEDRVDRYVCLGDVVGYGADPNACCEVIRGLTDTVLAGNHDWAAVGLEDTQYFNPVALSAIRWTGSNLSEANAAWLKCRPLEADFGEAHLVHASPDRPETWSYISEPVEARWALAHTEARLCFVGHSHHPFACSETGSDEVIGDGCMKMHPGERYMANPGSVGQPRDGDSRAAFAVWDQEAGQVTLHRVVYDLEKAQLKINRAGLPAFLAERLSMGW